MSEFKIRKYAVVGAGNMGSGIAQKIASEGHRVTLLDLSLEQVEKGLAGIAATLEAGVERRIFRPQPKKETNTHSSKPGVVVTLLYLNNKTKHPERMITLWL